MENMITWFFKVANFRSIISMCIIYLIFPLYLLPKIINTGSTGTPPLDLLFWYNHDTLYQMMTNYGEAARNKYIIGLLTVDIVYPIFYGTLLAMIMALIIKKLPITFPKKIIFIPYIVVVFDLIENSGLVFLLSTYPTRHNVIADIVGFVTATKWSVFVITVMFIIYAIVYGILIRKRKIHNQ